LAWAGFSVPASWAQSPAACADPLPSALTIDAAVRWGLEHNPELAALREQHGIAAAAVIIANTYPFNPIYEGKVRPDSGPASAGVTNAVSNEHKLLFEVELHHQCKIRRAEASAALSRIDWDIATQELNLAMRVVRAFNANVYRQEKLRLIEEIIRLNEQAADQVRRLVDQARLRPADLIVARAEVEDSRSVFGSGRLASVAAVFDLRRALGAVDECIELHGTLEIPARPWDCAALTATALEMRPELHSRHLAVGEADARLQLAIANKCGNPIIGPAYELNETNVSFIGIQMNVPVPIFNRHKGEIQQREAERGRAALDLRQAEVAVRQDVQAALARLDQALAWVQNYQTQTLPNLRTNMDAIQRLFEQGDPGVDIIRVLDIRRKLLKARSDYLDAQWEMSQALADLAAAVGDPSVAFGTCAAIAEAPPTP
jgi:cobalt-zinc-cadmium efflux system outer membrane protein